MRRSTKLNNNKTYFWTQCTSNILIIRIATKQGNLPIKYILCQILQTQQKHMSVCKKSTYIRTTSNDTHLEVHAAGPSMYITTCAWKKLASNETSVWQNHNFFSLFLL